MLPTRLSSGGIIANYRCPAACGHCLYGCGPNAAPGYITVETAEHVCAGLKKLGCPGLHIGGGEPFLNIDGLIDLIKTIIRSGLDLEYIETNAAWVTEGGVRDRDILRRVMDAGGDTIMVSADPFHVGFIPFRKPVILIKILRETGARHFIWQERYLKELTHLDPDRTHTPDELEQFFGYDIVGRCAGEYGMNFNGRALNLIRRYGERKGHDAFLTPEPCGNLSRGGHFHADLFGRYVAPGCTGMGVMVEDMASPLFQRGWPAGPGDFNAKYPVMAILTEQGLAGLYDYAADKGFAPDGGYVSKCDLCFSIRKYLIKTYPGDHPDLAPAEYYNMDF